MSNLSELLQLFALFQYRVRTRQALLALDSNQLKDIGITRGQAIDEASRPFWTGNSAFFEKSLRIYKKENLRRFVGSYPRNRPNYKWVA